MTVKEVVVLASNLVGLDDVVCAVDEYSKMTEEGLEYAFKPAIKKKIDKLISCINLCTDRIAVSYVTLKKSEALVSDFEGKIAYSDFAQRINRIEKVEDSLSGRELDFRALPFHLYLPYANRRVTVTYSFTPAKVTSLEDEISLPPVIGVRTLALGVVSDFLLSKNIYDESKYWNERFEESIVQSLARKQNLYLRARKFL